MRYAARRIIIGMKTHSSYPFSSPKRNHTQASRAKHSDVLKFVYSPAIIQSASHYDLLAAGNAAYKGVLQAIHVLLDELQELREIKNELENVQVELDETHDELEETHEELENARGELEDKHWEMEDVIEELDETRQELQEAQSELREYDRIMNASKHM
ncbi:hypothetical protein NP233_g11764 [Leucocoprinus birnbaumii]|uniref:Uncharacterized protein n=1 Tax=Leucocoprinus birnbaumii TaxID=56174 RepID=A0AAD5VHJ6_9AGAR|nr:hypothetical protein NP233_g11764 [Leucocoprinus birnbaumii]